MLEKRKETGDIGGHHAAGAYDSFLKALIPHIAKIYGDTTISERHYRHPLRESNIDYNGAAGSLRGLVFAGMSPDGLLPKTVDMPTFIPGSSACSTIRN